MKNSVIRWMTWVVVVAAAAGCASPPTPPAVLGPLPARSANTEADPQTRARIHTELASGYFELGNYAVAPQAANEAIKADPSFGAAYNVLGLVYMELRDDRAAENNFQRALRLNEGDSDANNNYGWFLCVRKREQESIKYFLAALRNPLYPTPDKSWVNAGLCSRQIGDQKSAEGYFQQALKVRPSQPQALFHLADMYFQSKDLPEAKTFLSRMGREVEPTAELLWLALRVERGLGDRNAGASLGFQLRTKYPQSRETRALLAGQYE